jgi:cytochrome c oxidase cbb3-type subunit 3
VRAILLSILFGGLVAASVASIRIVAQGNPDAAKIQNPIPASPESATAGRRLFQRYCSNCHGSNAEGGPGNDLTPPAPDLTTKTKKHGSSDGEIFNTIKNGVPPDFNMAAWGEQGLKEPDIWNLVNYLRSVEKK